MKKHSQKNISKEMLNQVAEELLNRIKERPREILSKRYGLDGSSPMVLDKIGKEFGVTRERIRQIENDSFQKLRKAKKSDSFDLIMKKTLNIIEKSGGFCEKKYLKESLIKDISQRQRNQLMFVLNSSDQLRFKKGNLKMDGFWFSGKEKIDKNITQVHRFIVKYFQEKKEPISFEEVLKYLRKDKTWSEFFESDRGENRLQMIFKTSRMIDKNIMDEWGLNNWKIISQRGSREKAYLVLRKHEEPLHFRNIAERINQYWTDKEALPQTVHNELIKDKRFVLVGRGIYGLHDWGYPEGTVKEIIVGYLEDSSGPIEKDLIVAYVLSKKQVKEATVLVALADQNVFVKTNEGAFTVKA